MDSILRRYRLTPVKFAAFVFCEELNGAGRIYWIIRIFVFLHFPRPPARGIYAPEGWKWGITKRLPVQKLSAIRNLCHECRNGRKIEIRKKMKGTGRKGESTFVKSVPSRDVFTWQLGVIGRGGIWRLKSVEACLLSWHSSLFQFFYQTGSTG